MGRSLEADAFELFWKMEFLTKNLSQVSDNILSKGGTEHPMVLYKTLEVKCLIRQHFEKSWIDLIY